jgi:class 3 adenylate cyclase/HAMP domain-containing protein
MFRHKLAFKVTFLIVGILITGFGFLLGMNIRQETEALVAKNQETARLLAASVTETIEVGMLRVRPDIVRRLIQQLKTDLKQVRRINVYRRNGVEAFADLQTLHEVNRKVHLDPELVRSISEMARTPGPPVSHPSFRRAVESTLPQQMYETIDGVRVLTLFQPLRNLNECQSCHGKNHTVRGVLQISLGLESLDAQLRAARNRQIFVALLTIIAVTVSLLTAIGRLVLGPVARVAAAARRIGGGDFEARVPVGSKDEIGQLGAVINDMTARLSMAYEELAKKNRSLDETLQNLKASIKRVELLEQLKNQLSKFVPESVKRMLERNPEASELEQCEKDISAIFLDIAGYTRIAEQMEPKKLNRLLQRYFSSFLESIHTYQGDVSETAGDGLMVIFQNDRSPSEHALNAIRATLAIQRQVEELNLEFAGIFDPVSLHMGINSGPALIGASKLSSSAGPRWIFTALGPVINIAARVAGEATAGEIFMTSCTAERVNGHFVLERLGERRLKNVADPVQLYRLIQPGVYDRVGRDG